MSIASKVAHCRDSDRSVSERESGCEDEVGTVEVQPQKSYQPDSS
jgi:hypothetical protein